MIHVDHLEMYFTSDPFDPITVLAVIDQRTHMVNVISTHDGMVWSDLKEEYYTTERCGMFGKRVQFHLRDFMTVWVNRGGYWP